MTTNHLIRWLTVSTVCCLLSAAGCGDASSDDSTAAKTDDTPKTNDTVDRRPSLNPSLPSDPPSVYSTSTGDSTPNRTTTPVRLAAIAAPKPLPPQVAALVRVGAKYDTDLDDNIIEVTYQKKKVTPAAWKAFQAFPNLEILDLDNTQLQDDDLKNVAGFKKLRILSLQENPITNTGLKQISGMKTLENLALAKTKITGEGLEHIAGLKKLQTLNLSFCNIGDEGLKHLTKMTDMETLALQKAKVTGPGLAHVGKLKNMITLTLSDSNIKGDSLLHLKDLSKLRIINMYDCKVSQTSVNKLENEISSLAIFR